MLWSHLRKSTGKWYHFVKEAIKLEYVYKQSLNYTDNKQTRITKFKLIVVLIIMLYIEFYCGKMSGKTVFLYK